MKDLPESVSDILRDAVDEHSTGRVNFPKDRLLEIDGVGESTASKIYENNPYLYSSDNRNLLLAELIEVEGIGIRKAAEILDDFDLY